MSNQTSFLKTILTRAKSPRVILTIIILLIVFIIEGVFDIVEIGVGQILTVTNRYRPQSGPVWQREIKDEIATQQLQTMIQESPLPPQRILQVANFHALIQALEENREIIISKANFLDIYSQLPFNTAQEIISPYELFSLMHRDAWYNCSIMRTADQLRIYLQDGENQLIRDCYAPLAAFSTATAEQNQTGTILEDIEEFRGRVIPVKAFSQAFNTLPVSTRIFIMNNPMQLIRWGEALTQVGISRHVIEGTVTIAFQVQTGISNTIVRYQASEIAATRLIEQINKIITDKYLAMPERKTYHSENEATL